MSIFVVPRPNRGARSRALKCGDDRGGAGGDAPVQASGPVRRHPDGWGGGRCGAKFARRAPAAQAAWSRRASRASPVDRRRSIVPRNRPPGAAWSQERWVGAEPRKPEKGAAPKRSAHRGSRGASLKHRARDAGEPADLRPSLPVVATPPGSHPGKPGSPPGRLGPARGRRSVGRS